VRDLPLIASILRALAAGSPVARDAVLAGLRPQLTEPEAERQLDTVIDWGRWAELFDWVARLRYEPQLRDEIPRLHGRAERRDVAAIDDAGAERRGSQCAAAGPRINSTTRP
jgi:hypothetical protein